MFDKSKKDVINQIVIVLKNTESLSEKLFQRIQQLNPNFKKAKSGACFIATAAMGDYDHPLVKDLREFRDNWLLKKEWGKLFTNWYYTYGPKAAKIIEKSNFLKKVVFIFLVKPLQIMTKKLK
jgi:hypothetical protein